MTDTKFVCNYLTRSRAGGFMRRKKDFDSGLLKNLRMDSSVYALRRQVMNIIYSIKKVVNLPRVDVRITESDRKYLGVAMMNDNTIWIPESTINCDMLYQIVLLELLHAVYGLDHVEGCPLMAACPVAISNDKALTLFKHYIKGRA